jgi:uncharacterized membrane protein YeaQ/YmgE (transglycosylase-associated protein family)
MSIIGWVIIGALAGWIASMVAGTNRQQGCITDVIVGIVGALLGGFLVGLITGEPFMQTFSVITLVVAVLGAIVVLFIWRAISRRRV